MLSNSHGCFAVSGVHTISYSNQMEVICGLATDLKKVLCAYSNVWWTTVTKTMFAI